VGTGPSRSCLVGPGVAGAGSGVNGSWVTVRVSVNWVSSWVSRISQISDSSEFRRLDTLILATSLGVHLSPNPSKALSPSFFLLLRGY
jgi:hypothetical protein